jgi:hypothetical protein
MKRSSGVDSGLRSCGVSAWEIGSSVDGSLEGSVSVAVILGVARGEKRSEVRTKGGARYVQDGD